MRRALVLGGGGAVGVAWETGVVCGLLEGGLDARTADLIVGTSAGSVVGTHLAHRRDPREVAAEMRSREPRRFSDMIPDPESAMKAFHCWGSFDEMTEAACAQVGRIALSAKTR